METPFGKETVTILRRLIAYSEKVFQFSSTVVSAVVDRRAQPRIPTAIIVKSVAVLFWTRMGSLNALELAARSCFFHHWLGQSVCGADSIGRVNALMDADSLRQGIHHIYDRLKRNKSLPDNHGIAIAVLDGHESHAIQPRIIKGTLQLMGASPFRFVRRSREQCVGVLRNRSSRARTRCTVCSIVSL